MDKEKLSLKDRINQFMIEHFYPTPPEESMPSLRGAKSGWSFRFSKGEKDTLLILLLAAVAVLLVISSIISMIRG